jgi:hypothetical protein
VVEPPGDAFKVSDDGRRATLEAKDVCVLDSFQFGGAFTVPASVNFKIRWEATGRREHRGSGLDVPPTDPAAFLGRFATARSTGTFSGSEVGFSFQGRAAPKVATPNWVPNATAPSSPRSRQPHLGAVNRVARPNRPALTERACQRAHPRRAARHSLPCSGGP